ncbi:MAG: GTPase HflX [Christensenellaceae bacterium]|nr:GTPase HflX [Christensenellaceae bacterium]
MEENNEKEEYINAILVRVNLTDSDEKESEAALAELVRLADTAYYTAEISITQSRDKPDPAFFVGSGKLKEIKLIADENGCGAVIFENDLSGSQLNNLEKELDLRVLDRRELILEIFALHATSGEGKLQAELAQKKNLLPRVLGQGIVLTRQGGGGQGGTGARRGGGEQQREIDKRRLLREILSLEERLKRLASSRDLRRKERQKNRIPVISIVGYTNAGKSTLMNVLTKAGVKAQDKLFATVDTSSRTLYLGEEQPAETIVAEGGNGEISVISEPDYTKPPKKLEAILSDTVGFVSRLPHEFVEAFKSTLEEAVYSDLILLVIDASSARYAEEYQTVLEVLESIGVTDIPIIRVLNKCDAVPLPFDLDAQFDDLSVANVIFPDIPAPRILISALNGGEPLRLLKDEIKRALFR